MQEKRKMCHQQKAPLRSLSVEERDQLERFSRSLTQAADQVIHAKEVLAVADGHSFTDAAKLAGRTSGEAVSPLPSPFNSPRPPRLGTPPRVGSPLPLSFVGCRRVLPGVPPPPCSQAGGPSPLAAV